MNSRQALGSFIPGPSKTLPEWNANALRSLGTDDFNGFMTIYNNNRCEATFGRIHADAVCGISSTHFLAGAGPNLGVRSASRSRWVEVQRIGLKLSRRNARACKSHTRDIWRWLADMVLGKPVHSYIYLYISMSDLFAMNNEKVRLR